MAVLIFKPSELCNANCLYCGVVKKHKNDIMSYELLETVFKRINEYLENNPHETLLLTWHGGEPCMLGVDYFRKALELQDTHCGRSKDRIKHVIQSNLTLITQEFIDVFIKLGIDRIGTSFEPIPNIRGIGNNRDSMIYNRLFFQGAALVEANNLSWGIIYVVHRKSLDKVKELFYYLTNINPDSQPMINQIYLYDEDKYNLKISPEEYADFLGELLPIYWENRLLYPHLKPLSSFIEAFGGNGNGMCDYSGRCANKWMYIGPEGQVSHCGRAGDFGFIDYGNIENRSIDEILSDEKREIFKLRQLILPQTECKDCRFWGLCRGGCPLDAYAEYGDFTRATPNCSGVKRLIEKYIEPSTGLTANLPPPEAMSGNRLE